MTLSFSDFYFIRTPDTLHEVYSNREQKVAINLTHPPRHKFQMLKFPVQTFHFTIFYLRNNKFPIHSKQKNTENSYRWAIKTQIIVFMVLKLNTLLAHRTFFFSDNFVGFYWVVGRFYLEFLEVMS